MLFEDFITTDWPCSSFVNITSKRLRPYAFGPFTCMCKRFTPSYCIEQSVITMGKRAHNHLRSCDSLNGYFTWGVSRICIYIYIYIYMYIRIAFSIEL